MTEGSRVRITMLGAIVIALISVLGARLWYLQVVAADSYVAQARDNQVREVPHEAIRGRILDRFGRVLVENRIATVITVERGLDEEDLDFVLGRLSERLAIPQSDLVARMSDERVSPLEAVPIAVDDEVPDDAVIYIREHAEDFPGVAIASVAVREYPNGSVASHLLGFVGGLNAEELAEHGKDGYRPGDSIGKGGVEALYEDDLRGEVGIERVEVDSGENVVASLSRQAPIDGHDVWLTIDLDVQNVAEESLRSGIEQARNRKDKSDDEDPQNFRAPGGAAVVLDANDGSVVAMASYPTYDPSEFLDGISSVQWSALNDPGSHYPLQNRVTAGLYAPGSTFKIITALAALQGGLVSPYTAFNDEGSLEIGGVRKSNAGGVAYGSVDLRRALSVSSDVYFYELGRRFWQIGGRDNVDDPAALHIQAVARQFGFGSSTGVGLAGEARGRVPDPGWKRTVHRDNPSAFPFEQWLPGENVNLSVGQGDLLATPLQLANAYATLMNGSTVFVPRLATQVTNARGDLVREVAPKAASEVAIPAGDRGAILDGLRRVISDEEGTASLAFLGYPNLEHPVAGKTGTAQVSGKQDTSLFAGLVPADAGPEAPKYVVVVLVEEGGFGSETAASIARRIIEQLVGVSVTPFADSSNSTP